MSHNDKTTMCKLHNKNGWRPEKSRINSMTEFIVTIFITARIRRMREGNIFSLFTLAGGGEEWFAFLLTGGTPSQVWTRVLYPRSKQGCWLGRGGTPSQVKTGGVPHPAEGVPPSKIRTGVPQGTPCPRLDRIPPTQDWTVSLPRQDWMGWPLSGDWSAKHALATRREVCLLRSSRRTFLLVCVSTHTLFCVHKWK